MSVFMYVLFYMMFPSIVQDKSLPTETSQGRKPMYFHHCNILSKYSVLSFENLNLNLDVWLISEIVHNIVTPFPIKVFFQLAQKTQSKLWDQQLEGTVAFLQGTPLSLNPPFL